MAIGHDRGTITCLSTDNKPSGGNIGETLRETDTSRCFKWTGGYWQQSGIVSNPPTGHYRVTNIYVDSATGKIVVKYDDSPVP